jgi:membrane peptidoglycan carboxypeptidase
MFVMLTVSVCIGVAVAGLAVPAVGLAVFGSRVTARAVQEMPLHLAVQPLPERSRLVDRRGRLITTFYEQNRVVVPLDHIDLDLQHAIVAIEDSRFYEHHGFDAHGTLRALAANALKRHTRRQGGSTITQQLVKMTLLQQARTASARRAATERTYARKLRELRYARGLEKEHSKQWILARYLNTAYFGSGAYGVETAAERYFSRHASRLTLTEAALIAGLVKNPTGFDPLEHPGRALRRRNAVLQRMAALGMVPARTAREAQASPLGLRPKVVRRGCISAFAPFFCSYARAYLLADKALGRTRDDRRTLLRTGGITVESTLSRRAQRAARAAVRRHVSPRDHAIGALAIVKPGNGKVFALAQSRPMGRHSGRGQTFLNYLVPPEYGDANGFQAGSTFKVFVLAAAVRQGIPLDTKIKAPPEIKLPVSSFRGCHGPLRSDAVWNPHNSTGSGTFDLYSGTQHSVNTFFAQLERRTGLCAPFRLARKMGVRLRSDQQVPTFTLGVVNTDPLTMAGAYATFAARGTHCASRPVTRVVRAGKAIATFGPSCRRVLPAAVADAVNDVLRGVQEPGGFGYSAGLGLAQPSAAKTGTTDSHKSVWYVGYTPNLAAAAMVAGADRKGHWKSLNGQVLGGHRIGEAAGSTTAGPIWGDAMHRIQRWLPDRRFVRPDPRTIKGRHVRVPDVRGRTFAEAAGVLSRSGLVAKPWNPHRGPTAGRIREQQPRPGSEAGSGSEVRLR